MVNLDPRVPVNPILQIKKPKPREIPVFACNVNRNFWTQSQAAQDLTCQRCRPPSAGGRSRAVEPLDAVRLTFCRFTCGSVGRTRISSQWARVAPRCAR